MKNITTLLFLLLAISLAFGPFNPLDLRGSGSISEYVEEQNGFTPFLYGLSMITCLLDTNVLVNIKKFKKYYIPLFCLLSFFVFSSVIFDITTVGNFLMKYIKLFVAFTGFYVFTIYFYVYPNVLRTTSLLFAFTCGIISLSFFSGLLEGFYFISNGRLWMFGENPNTYSFILGLGVLMLTREIFGDSKLGYKGLCCVFVLSLICLIFLSGSRGTLVFLGLSLMLILYDYLKKHLFVSIFIIAIIVFAILFFISQNQEEIVVFERFLDLQGGDSREDLIKNALSLFYDNPLYGYGLNGYEYMKAMVFYDMRDSHNMFVSILAVSGLFGFSAITTFLLRVSMLLKKIVKKNKYVLSLFVYTFLISMKTGGIITYSMMWFIYAVIVANATLIHDKCTMNHTKIV